MAAKKDAENAALEPQYVKVRALRTGFYGEKVEEQQLREKGSEFSFLRLVVTAKDGTKQLQPIPSWCEPVDAKDADLPVAPVPPTQGNQSVLEAGLVAVM